MIVPVLSHLTVLAWGQFRTAKGGQYHLLTDGLRICRKIYLKQTFLAVNKKIRRNF